MRLSEERIKEALLDPHQQLRDAALRYLAAPGSTDASVMLRVIEAYDRYGLEAFNFISCLLSLSQTDESARWLATQLDRDLGEEGERKKRWFVDALHRASPAILTRQWDAIDACRYLDGPPKEHLRERIEVSTLDAVELWDRLFELCLRCANDDDLSDRDAALSLALVDALAGHSAVAAPRTLNVLSGEAVELDELPDDFWYMTAAAQLAGKLRLEPAIPHLVEILGNESELYLDAAATALTMIGTDEVANALLATVAEGAEWLFAIAAIPILGDIRTDRCVRGALELAERQRDPRIACLLLQAALDNFADEAIEPARQYVLDQPLSVDVLDVRKGLLTACRMMDRTFPEFEAWLEDSRRDNERRLKWYRTLDQLMSEVVEEEEDLDESPPSPALPRTKVGRNDPCPCGSGKKFKKCCYRKPALAEQYP